MDSDKLKGYIKEKKKTQKQCAEKLKISEFQFGKKVNGEVDFWLWELAILAGFLCMTEKKFFEIFMPEVFAKELEEERERI